MGYDLSENDVLEATNDLPQENSGVDGVNNENAGTGETNQQQQFFKYKANDKEIEEPIDTILKRASMGYNYAQHMERIKAKEGELTQKEQQVSQLESQWRQYDEYAKANPQWADHVRTMWESRNGVNSNINDNIGDNQQSFELPNEIRSELQELRSFKDQYLEDKRIAQQRVEDDTLAQEISKVKNEYKDFDFSSTDPNSGASLEYQVIAYANKNGINSFRAAFRDMMHDQIIAKAATKAKEEAAKAVVSNTRKGFLGESDTSLLSGKQASFGRSGRNRSYNDLVLEGGKELGLF